MKLSISKKIKKFSYGKMRSKLSKDEWKLLQFVLYVCLTTQPKSHNAYNRENQFFWKGKYWNWQDLYSWNSSSRVIEVRPVREKETRILVEDCLRLKEFRIHVNDLSKIIKYEDRP